MNAFSRFRAWGRQPTVRPWFAAFIWSMTLMNVLWCFEDVRKRFDARAATQRARMSCEAEGGFYGSPVGAFAPKDRCVRRPSETARADLGTR